MPHPITNQRKAMVIYLLVWVVVIFANAFFVSYTRKLGFEISIVDALVSNLLFGLLGLLVWYPTRYIPFQKQSPVYSVSAHVVAGLLVIFVWLFLSMAILGAIFNENQDYKNYLSGSLYLRVILGIMIYLVLVLVYYLVIYARNLKDRAHDEERLRTLVKESELNMLKSQINPHFLFNALNSVSSLIMSNPAEAQEMIHRLSDFIRYSLKHRENDFVPLSEEIGRMKDYLAIEKVRFGDRLQYKLVAMDQCYSVNVPTMILQPIIENAIKHGVYESLEPVGIDFNCTLNDDMLSLCIKNDFDPSQPSQRGTGLGLQNVSERIRISYDGKGSVQWYVEGGKFIVELLIPDTK